ncbi:putative ATP-dependent RNA helicase DHX30 [Harpegnathos saltator]|uniref:putative ATP-dependent RNA helicase DHX30 n=1 Tax=Harpegnathos saltator TaxID=610380 RepID=UPI00058E5A1F|nr:putative ATP-dependent RNA helicase DHX30 [Harpegnathos saltator]
MSGTFLVFAKHRSTYRCIQQCCIPYLYKNVKDMNVHSAMQYCTSIKEENKHLNKVKDFEYEDTINTNNLDINTKSGNIKGQYIDDLPNDIHNKENINSFTSNKILKDDILISKKLKRLYQVPKNSLLEIYRMVCQELNDQTLLTSSYKQNHTSQLWEFTYNIKWPETMSFTAVSRTKSLADKTAALKCLEWLEVNRKLKNGVPIIYSKEQIRNVLLKRYELRVAPEILDSMENLIETYKMKIKIPADSPTFSYNVRTIVPGYNAFGHPDVNVKRVQYRNRLLQSRLAERCVRNSDLPIFEFRDKILSMLENNRILLIEGDTGCGKSTQVPQFILDSYTRNGNATDCNILVSQPRRISAISLGDRVAYERREILKDVVGYQVRLENQTPQELGRIVYCTTGILLKKLQCSPGLEGCSHVILDEAHERSIDTDMLMILLKRALDLNPDLKILVMSATINSHLFQEYFDCPVIKVPGRLYPVEMNFLEDIENLPDFDKYKPYLRQVNDNKESILVDYVKIIQTIKWISANKPRGTILCFLPGWTEISQVQRMLEDDPISCYKQLLLPLHSKKSHKIQRRIFQEVADDTRKIILATDIAETGITIPDVRYVVDTAIRREIRWDDTQDLLRVSNEWITQANIKQRKGRAGRVQSGISYHLIKRSKYDDLKKYPIAQILSSSLEKIILESKTYINEKAEVFFSDFLEPPAPSRVQKGVNYLIELGALDNEENLTALGKRMIIFSAHPKFSKALVYSTIFKCIHPVVTITSIFSGENTLFSDMLSDKSKMRTNKATYHPSSDHVAMSWIFKTWYAHNSVTSRFAQNFCTEMDLRHKRMKVLSSLRELFVQQMITCRLLSSDNTHNYNAADDVANKYENNDELVRAILYAATQQLIEHKNVGFKKGIVRTGLNELRVRGMKVIISGDSVNYKRKAWPSPYLTYFYSEHCNMRQRMVIRETSMVSPLTVLLFNQKKIQCHKRDDRTELEIDINKQHTINFSCDKRTADTLLKFRDLMWFMVQHSLEKQGVEYDDYGSRLMSSYKDQLFETVVKALNNSSECIEDMTRLDNDETRQ